MSTETKTYTALSEIPTGNGPGHTPIKQCSALLPNRMQCMRAGDFVVTVINTETSQKVNDYQLCKRHKLIEEEVTRLEAAKTAETIEVDEQKS